MTEEEAGTKWCPHAIASHTNPRQHNGEVWLHNCIGSACMAWRWAAIPNPDYKPGNYQVWPTQQPVGDPWIQSDTLGGCGLAGKP